MLTVETPYPFRVAARFTRLAESSTDAQGVSDAIIALLRDMDTSLSPIIGRQSFLSLMNRSIALTGATRPWPGITLDAADVETSLAALRSALARQLSTEAAVCGAALVATLHGSLTALIGHSLTERLLHNVGRTSRNGSL